MSRSGYTDDIEDNWQSIMWRGRVASSIRGKRGQKLLRELAAALDAMPIKSLVAHELMNDKGEHCALGLVGACRGIDIAQLDPEDYDAVAAAFDIAAPLAQEIAFENDEGVFNWKDAREDRWQHMREWVERNLRKEDKT